MSEPPPPPPPGNGGQSKRQAIREALDAAMDNALQEDLAAGRLNQPEYDWIQHQRQHPPASPSRLLIQVHMAATIATPTYLRWVRKPPVKVFPTAMATLGVYLSLPVLWIARSLSEELDAHKAATANGLDVQKIMEVARRASLRARETVQSAGGASLVTQRRDNNGGDQPWSTDPGAESQQQPQARVPEPLVDVQPGAIAEATSSTWERLRQSTGTTTTKQDTKQTRPSKQPQPQQSQQTGGTQESREDRERREWDEMLAKERTIADGGKK